MDLLVALLFSALLYYLFRGAIFVPTAPGKVAIMMQLAQIKPGMLTADLGSGDGRLVLAMARAGAAARGYEINPLLVWWSRRKIRQAGLQDRATIHLGDFWKTDFAQFDVVMVFGIDYIMGRLARKLHAELKPGARVLSYAFALPGWKETLKDRGVYLYETA